MGTKRLRACLPEGLATNPQHRAQPEAVPPPVRGASAHQRVPRSAGAQRALARGSFALGARARLLLMPRRLPARPGARRPPRRAADWSTSPHLRVVRCERTPSARLACGGVRRRARAKRAHFPFGCVRAAGNQRLPLARRAAPRAPRANPTAARSLLGTTRGCSCAHGRVRRRARAQAS
jgi:hypothetical protein